MPTDPLAVPIHAFTWVGGESMHLDDPAITACRQVVIGRYGGNVRAGANKNEDGALVYSAADGSWEFAMIIDAHLTTESAELLLYSIDSERRNIVGILAGPVETAFNQLEHHLLSIFRSVWFREQCKRVKGEASLMFCARKGDYLWWLSIGDCVTYVLDPQLAGMGQFALNQRNFYEWIGHINSFDQPVPTYTRGVTNLSGNSLVLMVTDGLLEFGNRPYENPMYLYRAFLPAFDGQRETLLLAVENALLDVHRGAGRDSATIIAWNFSLADMF